MNLIKFNINFKTVTYLLMLILATLRQHTRTHCFFFVVATIQMYCDQSIQRKLASYGTMYYWVDYHSSVFSRLFPLAKYAMVYWVDCW